MDARLPRLLLHVLHQCHRVQPHRHDAPHSLGQAPDDGAIAGVALDGGPGRVTSRQHPELTRRVQRWSTSLGSRASSSGRSGAPACPLPSLSAGTGSGTGSPRAVGAGAARFGKTTRTTTQATPTKLEAMMRPRSMPETKA